MVVLLVWARHVRKHSQNTQAQFGIFVSPRHAVRATSPTTNREPCSNSHERSDFLSNESELVCVESDVHSGIVCICGNPESQISSFCVELSVSCANSITCPHHLRHTPNKRHLPEVYSANHPTKKITRLITSTHNQQNLPNTKTFFQP